MLNVISHCENANATRRHDYYRWEWAQIKKADHPMHWSGYGGTGILTGWWWEQIMEKHRGKESSSLSETYTLHMTQTFYSRVSIHEKWQPVSTREDSHTNVHSRSITFNSPNLEQPDHLLTGERISKYIRTTESYSVIERNGLLIHENSNNLKVIMPSRSQRV